MTAPRVWVTGAGGFVGKHLLNHLHAVGIRSVTSGREWDLRDFPSVRNRLQGERVDICLHLAAINDVPLARKKPREALETNVRGTWNLMEAIRVTQPEPPRIILAGSVRTHSLFRPAGEEAAPPLDPYTWSKRMQAEVGHLYADAFNLPVTVALLPNLAGPGMKRGLFADFADRVVDAEGKSGTDPLPLVMGEPSLRRRFLDVRDAVRNLWSFASSGGHPGFLRELSGGTTVSVGQIARLFEEEARRPVRFKPDSSLFRPDEPSNPHPSPETSCGSGSTNSIPLRRTVRDILQERRQNGRERRHRP